MTLTLIPLVLAILQAPSAKSPESLIERAAKEKAPVWADGDTATFFHRGEADAVTLLIGGDTKKLTRLPDSKVWTAEVTFPRLQEGVFNYALLPRGKDEPVFKPGQRLPIKSWRGPKAPPAPTRVETAEVKGKFVAHQFDSKALGGKRGVRVYLPPGHDKTKTYPVVYATDTRVYAEVLEPLITSRAVRPVIVVGVEPGGYLGERKAGEHDIKRICERWSTSRAPTPTYSTSTSGSSARRSCRGPRSSSGRRRTGPSGRSLGARTGRGSRSRWGCGGRGCSAK